MTGVLPGMSVANAAGKRSAREKRLQDIDPRSLATGIAVAIISVAVHAGFTWAGGLNDPQKSSAGRFHACLKHNGPREDTAPF
jgi:hypothetical protein